MKMILVAAWFAAAFLAPAQELPKDPFKEMQRRAEKAANEKNYQELKEAADEMADLSKQISDEISEGGEHVISARIFDRLDKIEKLAKRVREKAKGTPAAVRK